MKQKRYFGLHFDFHAENTDEIGGRTTVEGILQYLEQAKPDFVQCDCKGHPGNACYPTKIGHPADRLVGDNLKVWREATRQYGVPLYVHYSSLLDTAYVKEHPDCAQRHPDGTGDQWSISLFSPYVDEMMIPQMKEIIDQYDVDGIWVDGDCWAVWGDDCSPYTEQHMKEGMTEAERQKVLHDGYLQYLKHYVDELHAYKPGFRIASNWAFSSYIPEKPEIALDWLSGDFPSNNSVNMARYEGRCLAAQRMPWDLMSWSFEWAHRTEKPAVQSKQEVAQAIALGGGVQVYFSQNRDGSAPETNCERLKEISDFVREREPLNFGKEPVAQVGLFYSAVDRYRHSNVFNAAGSTNALIGTLNCLLDAQYTVQVILEYQIDELEAYDMVVIPQWVQMGDEVNAALRRYVENGGILIVVGADSCVEQAAIFGLPCRLDDTDTERYLQSDTGLFAKLAGPAADCGEADGEAFYTSRDIRDRQKSACKIAACGKGQVCLIPFDLGTNYFDGKNLVLTDFLRRVLRTLKEPVVEVSHKQVDITMQKDGGALVVNLLNMRGEHADWKTIVYDEVPEIYDVAVRIYGAFSAAKVPLQPEAQVTIEADGVLVRLKRLHIHEVICLETK